MTYVFWDAHEKGKTYVIGASEGIHREKMTWNEEEKSAISSRQCTVSEVGRNDGKTASILLWIASASTIFSWVDSSDYYFVG